MMPTSSTLVVQLFGLMEVDGPFMRNKVDKSDIFSSVRALERHSARQFSVATISALNLTAVL
jgi:hypothetical protein